MWNGPYDYDPEKDKLPSQVTAIIIVAAIVASLYLSFVVLV